MKEEFLFSNTLSATTTAADVNALVESLFEANELSWQNFKHICSGGSPTVIGVKSGLVTLVKNEWHHVTSSHCSLHQHTLASNLLSLHLMEVMNVAIKVINFVCSIAKNHRLFQLLAKEMGTQHVGLWFYIKFCWLSRGKRLSRLYKLKNEVEIFLRKNKSNLHIQFHNEDVCCDVCVPGRCIRPPQRHELFFARP